MTPKAAGFTPTGRWGAPPCRRALTRREPRFPEEVDMFVRRRPLMRAAMVGGVAYHAGKRSQEGREADYDRDARIAELEAQQMQQQPAAAPPAASGGGDDMVTQLQKLAQLKEQGILTDEEFAAQKQKLLGAS